MKDYNHQVHLIVFGNREFHHHTNNKEKIKFLKLSNTEKTATKNSFFSKQNGDSKNWRTKQDSSTFNNYKLHTRHHGYFLNL